MPQRPTPQPGGDEATLYRSRRGSIEGFALLLSILSLLGVPADSRAQVASLFPPGALLAENLEPARAYSTMHSPDQIEQLETRHFSRGGAQQSRVNLGRDQPYAHSQNIDWIGKSRIQGRRSGQRYRNNYLPDLAPAYQVYGRQQHHGRSGAFGTAGRYGTSLGSGHGGFQGSFANAGNRFDPNRAPNFQFGPLSANFTGHASAEWLDRLPSTVQQSSDEGQFIISSGIDTSAQLQVSENGLLEFQIGVGLDYYPDGRAGDDGAKADFVDVQVLPSSYTSYKFGIGQAEFSIYDRFARFRNRSYSYYSLDPLDYADYQDHAIGATVRLPVNDRISADGGYEFGQLDSLGDGGEFLDRMTNNVFGGLAYSPDGVWEVGVQTSASSFDYAVADRPDGSSQTAGVFGNLPLSDYTRISIAAGVHQFEFDEIEGFIDSESLETSYWSASIENDLNDLFTHSLKLNSGAEIGISSNYIETTSAGYDVNWRIADGTVVTGGIDFRRSTESGGLLAEELESVHYRVGVRQEITEHTTIGADLSQSTNQSDLSGRDYDQKRLQIYCAIELNERVDLRLSYQRWETDARRDTDSFAQNSASLGLTYQF